VLAGCILAIGLLGPLVTPNSPSAIVGAPFQRPTSSFPFGTDFLGRDVLSRVLAGGLSLLWLSLLATALAYAIGITAGLIAGYARSIVDPVLMRAMDILLAFPPILFLLVLAAGAGHSKVALVCGIAVVQLGGVARIVRAATLEISVRNYVEAAVARGQATWRILIREILPNISGSILADAGVRLTGSILLLASVNFLGLGLQPPTADWALMISENRSGITLQPWVIAVPAVLIAVLTIAVNLIADATGRGLGVSVHPESVKR
jgi:ABC-type dipeptide/oligopeptide/nickel transport system permease subunit